VDIHTYVGTQLRNICIATHIETLGVGVETQENKTIFVPLSKKDKNKKSHERWT